MTTTSRTSTAQPCRPRVIITEPDEARRPDPCVDGAASPCPDCAGAHEPLALSRDEAEPAAGDALDLVPEALMDQLDNVVFLVEDEPPPDDPELLGVYDGVPLTERDLSWGGSVPDRITIFRGPLLRLCGDREELLDETGARAARRRRLRVRAHLVERE